MRRGFLLLQPKNEFDCMKSWKCVFVCVRVFQIWWLLVISVIWNDNTKGHVAGKCPSSCKTQNLNCSVSSWLEWLVIFLCFHWDEFALDRIVKHIFIDTKNDKQLNNAFPDSLVSTISPCFLIKCTHYNGCTIITIAKRF